MISKHKYNLTFSCSCVRCQLCPRSMRLLGRVCVISGGLKSVVRMIIWGIMVFVRFGLGEW